jgi:lambda repressor-like predicted transcriptional regulator
MAKTLQYEDIIALLRKDIAGCTLRDHAGKLGVSLTYLADVLKGTRPLTNRILEHYGLVREVVTITTYRKIA